MTFNKREINLMKYALIDMGSVKRRSWYFEQKGTLKGLEEFEKKALGLPSMKEFTPEQIMCMLH